MDLLTVKTIFKSQSTVKIEFWFEWDLQRTKWVNNCQLDFGFVNMKTSRPTAPHPEYIKWQNKAP
jgi:acyl-CoA thioester hydrolase